MGIMSQFTNDLQISKVHGHPEDDFKSIYFDFSGV